MLNLATVAPEAVWRPGHYGLFTVAVEFPDAAEPLPASWGPRAVGEMDAYFREVSGGAIRWRFEGSRRVRLSRPSTAFHLVRRTLADRVRFWRHLRARLGEFSAALLVVVPEEAAVRGCFAVGPRWNSPRLDAALRPLEEGALRGAVVRAGTAWGTMAHELGHVLGLPDLYDYWLGRRRTDLSASRYVGAWDLMGRASGEGAGARPHPMAWTKALAGWATVEEWDTKRTRYRLGRAEGAAALRIPLAPSRALFVEARLRLGFDAILPTEGVLLSVADEGKTEGRGPLRVMGPDRPHDPAQEAHFGAHWNAALQPGECYTCQGYAVTVTGRTNNAYDIEVTRA